MGKLTNEFPQLKNKTQVDLDFINICLETDNLLFVDPHLIKQLNQFLEFQKKIGSYWALVLQSLANNKPQHYVLNLLSGTHETNEIRLGYSNSSPKGKGAGKEKQEWLYQELKKQKLVSRKQLGGEFIEFFIEGIGVDLISDITISIIKKELIDYTNKQCSLYKIPTFKHKIKNLFDEQNHKWIKTQEFNLPQTKKGEPIIFTPKKIVRKQGAIKTNVNRLYSYYVRKRIINRKIVFDSIIPSGRDKSILIKDAEKVLPRNKAQLTSFMLNEKSDKILIDFQTEIMIPKLDCLSDNVITSVINKSKKC